MNAVVNTNLNVRTQKPSVQSENPLYLAKGESIEIKETVIGDLYEDNNIWYKLKGGTYVWSGGVDLPLSVNYNKIALDILGIDPNNTGKDIKIAIFDTGITPHRDIQMLFTTNKIEIKDFTETTPLNCIDTHGHGTHLAGIISGQAINLKGVRGVSPDAKMFIAKIVDQKQGILIKYLKDAFQWAFDTGIDIINISQGIEVPEAEYKTELKPIINRLLSQNVTIICSAGDDDTLEYDPDYPFFFPASLKETISVGGLNRFVDNVYENLDILMPNIMYYSTFIDDLGSYKFWRGSSMSTAFISGVVALLISENNNRLHLDSVRTKLAEYSKEYQQNLILNRLIFYKT